MRGNVEKIGEENQGKLKNTCVDCHLGIGRGKSERPASFALVQHNMRSRGRSCKAE